MARLVHLVPLGIIIEEMKFCFVELGVPGFIQCDERTCIKYSIRACYYDKLFPVKFLRRQGVALCKSSQDNGLKANQYEGTFYHL